VSSENETVRFFPTTGKRRRRDAESARQPVSALNAERDPLVVTLGDRSLDQQPPRIRGVYSLPS